MDAYTLTAEDVTKIRRTLVRDEWVPYVETGLTLYNINLKRNFVEDADLQSYADQILLDKEEELDSAWETKYGERVAWGEADADAQLKATAGQVDMLLRLVAAEVLEDMAEDALYLQNTGLTSDSLREKAKSFRVFAESRTGAMQMIAVHRK